MDAALLVQYKAPLCTYPNPTRYFIFNFLIISFIFIENECLYDAIWDLKRERKKKARPKAGSNHRSIASRRHHSWFTICAIGANASVHSAVLLLVLPLPWLTDVSSSQQWVIYSKKKMALSQTIPTSSGLSDLSLCFLTCYFVFEFVIVFSDLL